MNYNELILKAVEKNETVNLLIGENGYRVEVSPFTSDVFPTDINTVLVNCFYKQKDKIDNIDCIFNDAFMNLLKGSTAYIYIAVLYFDACIFQEERGKATFLINKELLAKRLKETINKNKNALQKEILFPNGLKKSNALKNIQNFNTYYVKEYGFSIID